MTDVSKVGFIKTIRRCWPYISHSRWMIAGLATTGLLGGFLQVALFATVAQVAVNFGDEPASVDLGPLGSVTLEGWVELAAPIALIFILLAAESLGALLQTKLAANTLGKGRSEVVNSYLDSTWSAQSQVPDGELLELLSQHCWRISSAALALAVGTTSAASGLIMFAGAAAISLPTLLWLTPAGLALVGLRPLAARARQLSSQQADAGLNYAEMVTEVTGMTRDMSIYGVRKGAHKRLSGGLAAVVRTYQRTMLAVKLAPVVTRAALSAALLLSLYMGRGSVSDPALLGAVVVVIFRALTYLQAAQTAFQEFAVVVPYEQKVTAAVKDFRSKSHPGETPNRFGSISGPQPVVLENIRYTHSSKDESKSEGVKGIDLEIEPGEFVAIVGPSGGGKSTLLHVIGGLLVPQAGSVRVGDAIMEEDNLGNWHKLVGFVGQHPQIIRGTIRDNIDFLRETGFSDDVFRKSAVEAGLGGELDRWDDGLDTEIGPRGSTISGGQMQRLSIARAFLEPRPVLLLDEPTSALDTVSEALVVNSLAERKERSTTIMVTHRPQNLALCDRVIVIDAGKIQAIHLPGEIPADVNWE